MYKMDYKKISSNGRAQKRTKVLLVLEGSKPITQPTQLLAGVGNNPFETIASTSFLPTVC